MNTLRDLAAKWRESASNMIDGSVLQRTYMAFAAQLSPFLAREERYLKLVEAAKSALVMLRECERDTLGSANYETFKAEADELQAALEASEESK